MQPLQGPALQPAQHSASFQMPSFPMHASFPTPLERSHRIPADAQVVAGWGVADGGAAEVCGTVAVHPALARLRAGRAVWAAAI